MTKAKRFEIELKIVEELRKRFESQKTNSIVLKMKSGKTIEVRKLPNWKMTNFDRYEVVSIGYGYIKLSNEAYYGTAEGLDEVASIIMKI